MEGKNDIIHEGISNTWRSVLLSKRRTGNNCGNFGITCNTQAIIEVTTGNIMETRVYK